MGLGKTLQTLSFLAALKHAGLPGPHLVVTPLAVLQNWANEMKRFTPGLSMVKVHGGVNERDRLLSDKRVLEAGYEATLTIKRSDFGMNWGVKNGALGDEVRLIIGLEGDWTA